MYKKKENNSAHCKSLQVVHTNVCRVVFMFVCLYIDNLKRSNINLYNLIKDKK